MKLVQLLAKELKEWPEGAKYITQEDDDVSVTLWYRAKPKYKSGEWVLDRHLNDSDYAYILDGIETASDNKTSIVTEDQWQAEREKMNKPKWIRHRGSWMPVGAATIVEVRLRCGDIQKHEACEFLWRHKDCDSAVNIMAYRVIEETKDQEIEEVKVAGVKLEMMQGDSWATIGSVSSDFGASVFDGGQPAKREEVKKTNFGTITYNVEIDATEATKEIDSLLAKLCQIESPLKWRDAIIHCQAIIEDCEREIERNVNLLDAEGLMMQKDSKKAMQHYQTAIDMSDWRNWQAGDIFEVVKKTDYFTVGNRYSVKYTANTDAPITATDDDGDEFCLLMEEIKFIRRP